MRFQLPRRILAAAAAAATLSVVGTFSSSVPAFASSPCTSFTKVTDVYGYFADIPSVGRGTGNTWCWMARGTANSGVTMLQTALYLCYDKSIANDGIFGPHTQQALREVQSFLHISVDGVYGPQTRDAMKWPFFPSPDGWWHSICHHRNTGPPPQ